MKRYSIYAAALSLAAIVSCQKEISDNRQDQTAPEVELESMTLITGDAQSKTSVSGANIVWTADDKIDIFSKTEKGYLTTGPLSATEVKGNCAKFEGKVVAGTTDFYAVYPSGVATGVAKDQINITVPTNQSPKADSFGEEMNVSVAKGTKTLGIPQVSGVAFHNVCSYLKFTIPSYVPDVKKVEVTCDRAIAGSTVVDYSALESGSGTITGFGNANTITMEVEGEGSFAAGSTFWFVLTPGDVKSLTIKLTTSDGSKWERKSTKAFTLKVATPKNLGTIDFFPALGSANATHTKSGETLTGTEVTVNLGLLSSMMSSVTAVNLQVTNGSGTVVRTYSSGTPATNSVTIPADSSWPYLPQGIYTISGTYTVNDGTTKDFTQTEFTSLNPTFGVEALGMTSYSYYLAKNSTQANDCDAETIYGLGGSAKISDAILNNANYSSLKGSYSYTLDGSPTNAGDKTGQSWAAHTITATYTFDGVTVTSELTCHVTGLPYKKDFTSDKGTDRWSGLNTDNNKYAVCLGYKYGSGTITYNAFSPSFNLPKSTNVKYTAIHYCGATGGFSPSGTIYSGVTDNNTTVQTQRKSISGDNWYLSGVKSSFTLEDSITMSSNSKISLSGSCEARSLVQNYVELARFEITYR